MSWRDPISLAVAAVEKDVLSEEQADPELILQRRGSLEWEAIRRLISEKSRQVMKEHEQDSDPVALMRSTAELSLLLAWQETR